MNSFCGSLGQHDPTLMVLSLLVAMIASFSALEFTDHLSDIKGRNKYLWLTCGGFAMGVGIWGMHFIGMLALSIPGLEVFYDVPLMLLSIAVAIGASSGALYLLTLRESPSLRLRLSGSLGMGLAIVSMHYIGIFSMRMQARVQWDFILIALSVLIAIFASHLAMVFGFAVKNKLNVQNIRLRLYGSIVMGLAIAGMHYTAMGAMEFILDPNIRLNLESSLIASDRLSIIVVIAVLFILGAALVGSNVEKNLARKSLLNQALQERLKAKNEFIAVASHELKTPLTLIKLELELLVRQLKTKDLEKEHISRKLDRANQKVNQMGELIDDLLDFSQMKSGKIKLNKALAEYKDLVIKVVDKLAPIARNATGHEIEVELCEGAGLVDPKKIEQLFSNVIGNSIKYGGGKPVKVCMSLIGESALFKIIDRGEGIAASSEADIFQMYERGGQGLNISGFGIGLFTSKKIVEAHDGKIWYESELGRGTTFFVELPLKS